MWNMKKNQTDKKHIYLHPASWQSVGITKICCSFATGREPRGPDPDRQKLKIMEQLNRIELRGIVGSVKVQNFNSTPVAHFTLATNIAYKDKDGSPVIETAWHSVTAWEGREIQCLESIVKGTKLYVCGRLRYQRVTGNDGVDRTFTDVLAKKIAVINDDEQLQYEMN